MILDGAMQTYFSLLHPEITQPVEYMNILHPEYILDIHKQYVSAGAQAIKTNTFTVNRTNYTQDECKQLIDQAIELAKQCDAIIFADIGPISSEYDIYEEYKYIVDLFIQKDITHFLFETQTNTKGLKEISRYIRTKIEDPIIYASFALQPDGFTSEGIHIQDIIDEIHNDFDHIGLNCGCGLIHMHQILETVQGITMIAPNAGYPTIIHNRTYYQVNPDYFAKEMVDMLRYGIEIIGGCCGTTPEHIQKMVELLPNEIHTHKGTISNYEKTDKDDTSLFFQKLSTNQKVIAVELDPPTNSQLSKFMKGAWQLKDHVDAITIADCPIGRTRMDSSILACKIKRELNLDVLPHMTCRDRNLNATKALLLGTYAEGIRDVLLVTGDPIPSEFKDEVKTVYQFNSRKLARYIKSLESKGMLDAFNLFGALNINALNFDIQLQLAKEKIKHGMIGFFTQPVLSLEAFENLKRAKKELDAYILGGVIPVVSHRNALFMENEINGIHVCQEIIDTYENKDRNESTQLAIDISTKIMTEIENYVDGFYLMTPFGRTELMIQILENYKRKNNA